MTSTDELLQVAFRDPVPSDVNENLPNDNSELSEAGKEFTESFISHYVKTAIPYLPEEAQLTIATYLTSHSNLAHLANNLGHKVSLYCNLQKIPVLLNCRCHALS